MAVFMKEEMSELSHITNNAQRSVLELRVFTSPARVIAGDPNRTFSPTISTLIFGARHAVLVDALLIREDVDALGDMIASTGRTLTTICGQTNSPMHRESRRLARHKNVILIVTNRSKKPA
jgi:hypothetical protein